MDIQIHQPAYKKIMQCFANTWRNLRLNMDRPKSYYLLCILVLLAFLSACASPVAKQEKIQLKPCTIRGNDAQCGTLRVYENRAAQTGRMINLNIVVIKAQSDHPALDPIFYLAGGPGGAAASEDAKGQQFPYSLSENHDLVFVDQRGTGGSNRVVIPTNQPDLSGLSPEEADVQAKKWVAKVLSEIDMDPRFYTTSIAMDDLDEVRQALGYDKINLVGYSYGATAAQYYLRQHEAHVRTMTLGVGSLLDMPVFELWAHNSQRALDIIFDRCQADAACHAAFPDLRTEFQALFARLAKEPVTVSLTSSSDDSQSNSVTFTADYFAAVVRHMMKDAKRDGTIPLLIHRAYHDKDWTGFTRFIVAEGGAEWWGDQIMEHVIRCDEKWAAFDPAAVTKFGKDSYFVGWDLNLAQNQALSCKYTPRGETPEGISPQPGSKVPVLILNGDMDPIDPPENMAGAKALWPNSISLVAPYQGHSLSDMNEIACWWSIQNQFIQSGSVEGLDTSCMKNTQPSTFVVPSQK